MTLKDEMKNFLKDTGYDKLTREERAKRAEEALKALKLVLPRDSRWMGFSHHRSFPEGYPW